MQAILKSISTWLAPHRPRLGKGRSVACSSKLRWLRMVSAAHTSAHPHLVLLYLGSIPRYQSRVLSPDDRLSLPFFHSRLSSPFLLLFSPPPPLLCGSQVFLFLFQFILKILPFITISPKGVPSSLGRINDKGALNSGGKNRGMDEGLMCARKPEGARQ